MKAKNIKFNEIVDVKPYYLYGRIVAYIGDSWFKRQGIILEHDEPTVYLPNELDFNIE